MKLVLVAFALVAFSSAAAAQHQHGHSPYAGFQQRAVKALSDQQIADLRSGHGMSLALAGELNGYPGPLHVLELSESLRLTPAQRESMQQLFDAMKAEAVPVGEQLIEQEGALDREFADQRIAVDTLTRLTAQIAETQGRLRAIHLKYHLTTAELLSAHQRHRYAQLRGYR